MGEGKVFDGCAIHLIPNGFAGFSGLLAPPFFGCCQWLYISDIIKNMLSDIIYSMSETIAASIEGKKRQLDSLRPLDAGVLRRLDEQFSIEWTYNSNALEGNTISLGETELVLRQGITIGHKTLREHFEILNHDKAVSMLKEFVQKKRVLTSELMRELHAQILFSIDDANAGFYRRTNVRILGAYHIPPRCEKVPAMMEELVAFYHENRYTMNPVLLAAAMHYQLVYIHPFVDGNGRTARLLMNLVLMEAGYPPAIILNLDRGRYLNSLNEANRGRFAHYFDFIGKSVERSLVLYLDACMPSGRISSNAEYITLQEASRHCSYSQEYLSLLARTNRLPAVKFGRNWMTTLEALESYIERHGKSER